MSSFGKGDKQVVLITGASAGFGKACAEHLSDRGNTVYGTSRSARFDTDSRPNVQQKPSFTTIPMDVCENASVETGIQYILDQEGQIDIVVNNAGFGLAGAFEDCTVEEVKAQFETNVFGVVRVCRTVLPYMRQRKTGVIVIMGSIAGLISVPFQSAYSASKFALEGFAEALRMEVKPFGIQVVLIEPGDFKTDFTRNRVVAKQAEANPAYARRYKRALGIMEHDEKNGPPPVAVARLLEKILQHPAPGLRYPVGKMSERFVAGIKPFLPGKIYQWLIMNAYKLR
jgi:short-subunit dehydrogenase